MPQTITFGAAEIDPASVVFGTSDASEAPTEGYWEHPRGGRIPQSAITANPEEAQRLIQEKGWQWHPPAAPGGHAMVSGVPVVGDINPEDVLYGYGLVRGVGAAARAVSGAVPRVVAGTQQLMRNAVPYAKFEAVKWGLVKLGTPEPLADLIAMRVSGYTRRGGATAEAPAGAPPPAEPVPAAAAPTAGPAIPRRVAPAGARPSQMTPEELRVRVLGPEAVSAPGPTTPLAALGAPAAAPPAAPAPPVAPPSPPPAPRSPAASSWSPQRIRNEVGLAARRAKVTLTEDQLGRADDLVQAGQTPTEAVAAVSPLQPPPKVKITAAEMGAYTELRRRGRSHEEATAAILAQRQLAGRLGTPTPEEVRQSVAEREVTGRWPD